MKSNSLPDKQVYIDIFNSIDFEKIIDHPNILIAANFWEQERYRAAKVCYRFMRYIDDLVDNYKSEHITIDADEKIRLETEVGHWIKSVMAASDVLVASEQLEASDEMKELLVTVARFHIPAWPLQAFAKSMIYDIYNDGFASLQAFKDYAAGASVAPAAIFVHLCGLRKVNGEYQAPDFDVRNAAESCAIFSYLVHIIRDFVKDHTHNLNYFPNDLMIKNNLDRQNLLQMAQGAPITDGFRNMIAELYNEADRYRVKTLEIIREIKPLVEPSSELSLEIIFALYTMVFDRIDIKHGTFTTAELNPTAAEIRQRVWGVIEGA